MKLSLTLSRTAAPVVLLAAALAGCGGPAAQPKVASAGGTPTIAPTTDIVGAYIEAKRAWVTCLRAEGLKVTDPDAKGRTTFEGDLLNLKADPKFIAAQQKCTGLLPPVPEELVEKPVLTAEEIETQRRYAKCMRENGEPDFPDPGPDGLYPIPDPTYLDPNPNSLRAQAACTWIHGGPATPVPAQG